MVSPLGVFSFSFSCALLIFYYRYNYHQLDNREDGRPQQPHTITTITSINPQVTQHVETAMAATGLGTRQAAGSFSSLLLIFVTLMFILC